MKLIYYKDDVLSLDCFIDNALDTALELSSELCSGNHCGKVELPDLHIKELLRNRTFNDLYSKALSYSGLTYTGRTYKNGIVLGTSVKNLDYTVDLGITSDNAVDLVLSRTLCKVSTEFIKILKTRLASALSGVLGVL